jgi:hypothetical protein
MRGVSMAEHVLDAGAAAAAAGAGVLHVWYSTTLAVAAAESAPTSDLHRTQGAAALSAHTADSLAGATCSVQLY